MDTNEQETTGHEHQSSRPAAKFSGTGGMHVAVWKNKTDSGADVYSVKMERNNQSTPYLRDSDLLRAGQLLELADRWIEQDEGRQHTQIGGQGQ